MKGIDAAVPHGRLIVGGVVLVVTCLIGACGNAPPSSSGGSSGPSTPDLVSARNSDSAGAVVSAAEELAKAGVSVTQFTPAQEAALYVTMGVEGMEVYRDGYDIPPTIAAMSIAGKEFRVPSDLKARWGLIDIDQKARPFAMIFTQRVGPAGTTLSIRQYDCEANTVRYLATGDSVAAMKASKPDERMSEIHPRSIAYYLGKLACTDLAG